MHVRITIWMACLLWTASLPAPAQNCSFTFTESHAGPTCPNLDDGWIDLTLEGNSSDFTFYWETFFGSGLNASAEDQTGLSEGIYIVTIVDTMGCEESLQIELLPGSDNSPPVITCPISKVVNLGPGACSSVQYFDVEASDDCHPSLLVSQTDSTGLSSGDAFPIGMTTLSYEATDGNQTVTCSFFIKVNEYDPPGNPSVSCAGPLSVSVAGNCTADLTADMLLAGTQHGCYDDYTVTFLNLAGLPITAADFPNYINKVIYGRVYDSDSNTFCFATITLKDFSKPVIHCTDTTVVSCAASLANVHPAILGYPEVTDNCGMGASSFFDQYNELDCNNPFLGGEYSAWIKRTWMAEDVYGNEAPACIQSIFFKRKNINDVVFPKSLTDQPGALPSLNCGNNNVSPAVTGAPTVGGLPIYPSNAGQCEFLVSYVDNEVTACGGGYNVLRTWTVSDVCNNELRNHVQIIQVKDKLPPSITCQSFLSVSTNSGNCRAALYVPPPQMSDDCSLINLQILHSSGTLNGNLLVDLAIGIHQVTYLATDECGNQSTCKMTLSVADQYAPIADCDPSKSVSLTSTGQTSISAAAFNDNSYDDCGGALQFSIRRLNFPCGLNGTDYANTVKFCCEDVGTSVPVELRVTDFSGNSSTCSSVVQVNDFMPPTIFCPTSFSISCEVDYSDLSVFGKIATTIGQQNTIIINGTAFGTDGFAMDNCSAAVEELSPVVNINDCHVGTISRNFRATDPAGLKTNCTQVITLVNNDPFYINPNNSNDPNDDVEYPPHITISDCSGNANPSLTGQPIILGNGCGQVSFTYSDQVLSQTGTSYVIKRKWTVVDFCQLGNGQGSWIYFQNITVQNSDVVPPHITGFVEAIRFCADDEDCQSGYVSFSLQATDDCTPTVQLVWSYSVDLHNDGTIDLTGNSNAIFGTLPLGIHKTTWKVTDGAGNSTTGIQFLLGDDCTPPTPICPVDTFYVTLNNSGVLFLSAEQMQGGFSEDNCTAYPDLRFEANVFDPSYILPTPPANALPTMSFTCPVDTYHLQLWVGDEMDNWAHCQFHLNVSDYFQQCDVAPPAPISIDGNIRTEDGATVGQASIQVNAGAPATSNNDGYFAFYDLPGGGDYSVIPRKNIAPLNGVTTYDMALIRRHILAIQSLDSPYKIIAADINKSNSVTTADLVALQKLILYVTTDFANNESWRFVDAGFVFPNPLNPFETPFPEVGSFNNLFENHKIDFIGIKVGDVNGSANPLGIIDQEGDEE